MQIGIRWVAIGWFVTFNLAGCAHIRLIPLSNRDVVALTADDVVRVMRRAGFADHQILDMGTDVRNMLATSGSVEIRVGNKVEAILAVRGQYVHVSSRQRGNFIYNMNSDQDSDNLYLNAHEANANLRTLKGRVINKNTGEPLGATIILEGKEYRSDVSGKYMIKSIPEGRHEIICSKDGFKRTSIDTLIQAASEIDFELAPLDTLFIQPGIEDGKDAYVIYSDVAGDRMDDNINDEELIIASWTHSGTFAYLRFDLERNFPEDANILKAILNLYSPTKWHEGNRFLYATKVLGSWKEDTITYSNQPKSSQLSVKNELKGLESSWFSYYFDITDYVKEWLSNPGTNYGVKIGASYNDKRSITIPSSENSDIIHRPKLEILYFR